MQYTVDKNYFICTNTYSYVEYLQYIIDNKLIYPYRYHFLHRIYVKYVIQQNNLQKNIIWEDIPFNL